MRSFLIRRLPKMSTRLETSKNETKMNSMKKKEGTKDDSPTTENDARLVLDMTESETKMETNKTENEINDLTKTENLVEMESSTMENDGKMD